MAPPARRRMKTIKKTPRLKDYKVSLREKVQASSKKGVGRKRSKQEFQKTWPNE